jgi:hypothetical protein
MLAIHLCLSYCCNAWKHTREQANHVQLRRIYQYIAMLQFAQLFATFSLCVRVVYADEIGAFIVCYDHVICMIAQGAAMAYCICFC